VMIQCVGSRNYEKPIAAGFAVLWLLDALKIKKNDPEAKIYVLYRDIRTYGFREIYYKKAREAGIVFIRYDEKIYP